MAFVPVYKKLSAISDRKKRDCVKDGDIILFDSYTFWESAVSWLIGVVTMSNKSHVEIAKWWDGVLCSVGMDECDGGRAIALEKHLNRGRRISIFRVRASAKQRVLASQAISHLLKVEYNHESIKKSWRLMGPLRMWTHWRHPELVASANDDSSNGKLHDFMCVEAVAWVWEKAGIDLSHFKAKWAMSPVEAVQSSCVRYLFTPVLDGTAET